MPRVKSTPVTKRRRNKFLKLAKGYYGAKKLLYKVANQDTHQKWRERTQKDGLLKENTDRKSEFRN